MSDYKTIAHPPIGVHVLDAGPPVPADWLSMWRPAWIQRRPRLSKLLFWGGLLWQGADRLSTVDFITHPPGYVGTTARYLFGFIDEWGWLLLVGIGATMWWVERRGGGTPSGKSQDDDQVRQEDRRLREVAKEDFRQLGNRMLVTAARVDFGNLNGLAPYIDFIVQGINCTVYTVIMGKSPILGRVVMLGNGHADVELQDPPRIIEGGPDIHVPPHETFRIRLRQPITKEVAEHLLYARCNTFVSFSFDRLEIEIETETLVSTGRKVVGLSPIGGDVPHFGNLPEHRP